MKKVLLSLLTLFIVLSQGIVCSFASDNELIRLQNYYKNNSVLKSPDDIMAVEAIGLEVEDGFSLYDIVNQDFKSMYLSTLVKTMIAMSVSSIDLQDVNGQNLVALLESYVQDDGSVVSGDYQADAYTLPWVIYALYIVDSPKLEIVADYLASLQDKSGGFGNYGWTDSDTTGQAIEAFVLVNKDKYKSNIDLGIQYLLNMQNEEGYFIPYFAGSANVDTQSNVLIALLNLNKDDVVSGKYDKQENIYQLLLNYQEADGSFGNVNSCAVTARAIGAYYGEDFFKQAKKEYQELLEKNKQEEVIRRKNSYERLKGYYRDYQVESYDDVLARISMGYDIEDKIEIPKDLTQLRESDLAKVILTMVAQGQDASKAVQLLEEYVNNDGSIGNNIPSTMEVWCLFALYVVDSSKLELVADHLASTQADNGMYGFPGYEDLDTTGWVMTALSLVNKEKYNDYINKAVNVCLSQQQESGTFGIEVNEWDVYPNANTQASVLMGLMAYDRQGLDEGKYSKENHPMDILLTFQNDDGSFGWDSSEYNALATTQVAWTLGSYYNGNVFLNLKNKFKHNKVEEDVETEVIDKEETKEKEEIIKQEQVVENKPIETISTSTIVKQTQNQEVEETQNSKEETKPVVNNPTKTVTKNIEEKKVVSNENIYLKYILIVLGAIVVLCLIKLLYSIIVKKDVHE